jgi:acetyl-CoA carboxylase biotin carboxyl carrier protein
MKSEQRKEIQDLVEILTEQNLNEIEVERKDLRIRIRRDHLPMVSSPQMAAPPVMEVGGEPAPQGSLEFSEPGNARLLTVTSPIVGTFYRSPSPDADSYVEENDIVSKGQVLCIVEAMKLMNEIESEADGRLVKALVESGASVEYGQPLFLIDPITTS